MNINSKTILPSIPKALRKPLIDEYNKILKNYRERRWEPTGLNGGKLAEITYSILKGHIEGTFPNKPQKPRNMVEACKNFENADSTRFRRSIRIQIPRILTALYDIRNNRSIGHVGDEVDPNHMDSVAVVYMSKWVLCELVRIFHETNLDEAQKLVESITIRESPLVWEVNGKRRVLNPELSKPHQTLLLLHSVTGNILEKELCEWVEHSNASVFRRDVLVKLHKKRLVEYNKLDGTVQISPSGIKFVEDNLLNNQ